MKNEVVEDLKSKAKSKTDRELLEDIWVSLKSGVGHLVLGDPSTTFPDTRFCETINKIKI